MRVDWPVIARDLVLARAMPLATLVAHSTTKRSHADPALASVPRRHVDQGRSSGELSARRRRLDPKIDTLCGGSTSAWPPHWQLRRLLGLRTFEI